MQKINNKWFEEWFNTHYYHLLYNDRNHEEAQLFIDNITAFLNLPENSSILDLACGKGRHSIYLNKLGYEVLGLDLSQQSIEYAKHTENDTLSFEVKDMQEPLNGTYDAIFNMFTSFGYFDTEDQHIKVLKNIKNGLKKDGFAVIDFLNVEKSINNLIKEETIQKEDITFNISRWSENKKIYKKICFEDKDKQFEFTEVINAFTLSDFERMMEQAGLYLIQVFGNYKLENFKKQESDRLILIFK